MRPHGTALQLEARRRRAVELLGEGKTLVAVARQVKSSVSSVKRWKAAVADGGEEGLSPKPTPGRPAFLSSAQQRKLLKALERGPRRHGFATDLWTCSRVAEVIRRMFDVHYHTDYVGRLLHQLGWSVQKPTLRAKERDEKAIATWCSETWPRLKKEPPAKS